MKVDAPRYGTGIGLERTKYLLEHLRIDRTWLKKAAIAVTGSNGKGSTAVLCSAVARGHGPRVGLFTSPHLYRIEERIKINGEDLATAEFEQAMARVQTLVAEYQKIHVGEEFGFFELLFACAIDVFFRNACDVCVLEAGIGGRNDPVRMAHAQVAAVTSLDLEHTALLGNTLEAICRDKIEICAEGGSVFFGENCLPLAEAIKLHCQVFHLSPLILGEGALLEDVKCDTDKTDFSLRSAHLDGRFSIKLLGRHQAANAALALLLFQTWLSQNGNQTFSLEKARRGLLTAEWPGRLEIISQRPFIVIDVGHTPDGILAGLQGLKRAFAEREFVLVIGVSLDKDAAAIVKLLAASFQTIVCTSAYYRGRSAAEIHALVAEENTEKQIFEATDIASAVRVATDIAERRGLGIFVTGGMYVAIEFAEAFRGKDPRELPHLF